MILGYYESFTFEKVAAYKSVYAIFSQLRYIKTTNDIDDLFFPGYHFSYSLRFLCGSFRKQDTDIGTCIHYQPQLLAFITDGVNLYSVFSTHNGKRFPFSFIDKIKTTSDF